MTDVHTPEIRSFNMSRIRSKNTRPEMLVRRALFSTGYRYRLHDKSLPGRPDIVLKKHKTVIFVHGCFWHGHRGCKKFVIPKTRTQWWIDKINRNIANDVKVCKALKEKGLRIVVIWECSTNSSKIKNVVKRLQTKFKAKGE